MIQKAARVGTSKASRATRHQKGDFRPPLREIHPGTPSRYWGEMGPFIDGVVMSKWGEITQLLWGHHTSPIFTYNWKMGGLSSWSLEVNTWKLTMCIPPIMESQLARDFADLGHWTGISGGSGVRPKTQVFK